MTCGPSSRATCARDMGRGAVWDHGRQTSADEGAGQASTTSECVRVQTAARGDVATNRTLSGDNVAAVKNKSELLLEGYLRNQGCANVEFEPQIEGTSKRPDYRLRCSGVEVLLEVKEF